VTLDEAISAAKRDAPSPYAQTYLRAIPEAIELGGQIATATEGLRVQLLYVLSNLSTWRGPTARAAKAAMKAYCKIK
jgi:hypothetical protein